MQVELGQRPLETKTEDFYPTSCEKANVFHRIFVKTLHGVVILLFLGQVTVAGETICTSSPSTVPFASIYASLDTVFFLFPSFLPRLAVCLTLLLKIEDMEYVYMS